MRSDPDAAHIDHIAKLASVPLCGDVDVVFAQTRFVGEHTGKVGMQVCDAAEVLRMSDSVIGMLSGRHRRCWNNLKPLRHEEYPVILGLARGPPICGVENPYCSSANGAVERIAGLLEQEYIRRAEDAGMPFGRSRSAAETGQTAKYIPCHMGKTGRHPKAMFDLRPSTARRPRRTVPRFIERACTMGMPAMASFSSMT